MHHCSTIETISFEVAAILVFRLLELAPELFLLFSIETVGVDRGNRRSSSSHFIIAYLFFKVVRAKTSLFKGHFSHGLGPGLDFFGTDG